MLLDDQAAHHIQRVLRLKPGDAVTLFDGSGGEYAARLTLTDGRLCADVDAYVPDDRTDPLSVTLWQAVCRGGRMDTVVEKATELGVRQIVPLMTRRVVVKLTGKRALQRAEHWHKVAVAACEQCGMNRVPEVAAPIPLEHALAIRGEGVDLPIWLDPRANTLLADRAPLPPAVTLLVGPEGGFAPEEETLLAASGFQRTALGPRTLRADTAGLAALSMLTALRHAAPPGAAPTSPHAIEGGTG
jgi:16S rRNA (uracil1498-N3)-methyltransferase